jgi:hypothetical protein
VIHAPSDSPSRVEDDKLKQTGGDASPSERAFGLDGSQHSQPIDITCIIFREVLRGRGGQSGELAGFIMPDRDAVIVDGVLAAGWPESVPGTTVDRQCGSSQQSIHFAAAGLIFGSYSRFYLLPAES